ncbi:hypothetical protein [Aeromicrobium chenweiae]|uniref:Uncharacterized protein n=1 Tax=Aeromicrobium chenweiae TaxID=2079793 RepID=A0A2S0WN41_9ACTN|nr:hypothetical protein [Aeromicrobium chenweiae]AWB92769.1 hypothetical protein C3E78_11460 [Aeromicrobium chenweiae]TGN33761.1 hypothetical protein E4L97_01510 [Aeromicrobium chenweiae]
MTTALTLLLLGGCGSDEPSAASTSGTPTSAAADPDGLTPEQREVVDAAEAYTDAIVGRGAQPLGPVIKDLVTKEVYDFIVPADTKALEDAGLQYVGQVTIKPSSVTITGDKALVKGCQDSSEAFMVAKGRTAPDAEAKPLPSTRISFGLVRRDGRWIVSDPEAADAKAC